MKSTEQARFDTLYRRHLRALKQLTDATEQDAACTINRLVNTLRVDLRRL